MRALFGIAAVLGAALLPTMAVAVVSPLLSSASDAPSSSLELDGVPPEYLQAYRQAAASFKLGDEGWSYLAGIGEVESDHGRSTAAGVHSGQNFHGCCAGPMQIHNGFGSGGGTWGAYAVDGNGDGRLDIYDIADAAPTAARYLRASGAPGDWPSAIFAYNHSQNYVAQVLELASRYRTVARPVTPATGTE